MRLVVWLNLKPVTDDAPYVNEPILICNRNIRTIGLQVAGNVVAGTMRISIVAWLRNRDCISHGEVERKILDVSRIILELQLQEKLAVEAQVEVILRLPDPGRDLRPSLAGR